MAGLVNLLPSTIIIKGFSKENVKIPNNTKPPVKTLTDHFFKLVIFFKLNCGNQIITNQKPLIRFESVNRRTKSCPGAITP